MALRIGIVAVAAVAWGLAGHALDVAPGGSWVTALGAPWLVMAFAAGALMPRREWGAAAGAAFIVLAVGVYYVAFLDEGAGVARYAVKVGLAWGAVGVLLGALFGAGGAVWRAAPRSRPGALAAAIAVGALAGEALLLRREWFSAGAPEALRLELLAAVLLAAATFRRPLALGAGVAAALLAVVAADELRELLRVVGWQGA